MKNNLREYRELLKLSQTSFAKLLKVSQGSISLYEAGKMPAVATLFSLKTLLKQQYALTVTLEDLIIAPDS